MKMDKGMCEAIETALQNLTRNPRRELLEFFAEIGKRVEQEKMEVYEERYVTGKELCQHISMFTPNWLEKYGWKLPRERIEVTDDGGEARATRWGYPLHQIQRMIAEGKMRAM